MTNKNLAIFGLIAYLISFLTSFDLILPTNFLSIGGIMMLVFVTLATKRLWKLEKHRSIIIGIIIILAAIFGGLETILNSPYGSLLVITTNALRFLGFIGYIYLVFFFFEFREDETLRNKNKFLQNQIKKYTKLVQSNSKDIQPRIKLSKYLIGLQKYDEAEKELREVIRLDPTSAEAHTLLGCLSQNLQKYDEAEKEYREAIRLDPKYAYAHAVLGDFLLRVIRKYDEAENELRAALRLNPNDSDTHISLGELFQITKQYNKAETEFREAIRLDPKYAYAHGALGGILLITCRYNEAEKELKKALSLDPTYVEAHVGLSILLNAQGRYEEAEKEYQEALRLDPDKKLINSIGSG